MEVSNDMPSWAVAVALFLLVAIASAFFRVIWGRYSMLEKKVDEMQREHSNFAKHPDILVLAERIRADYMATQTRLDDIHKMIVELK